MVQIYQKLGGKGEGLSANKKGGSKMRFLNKFLVVAFCLSIFSIYNQELSHAGQICANYIPPDRTAADRIAAYINYFTGGQASVIPPELNDDGNYYAIDITQQPSGYTIDPEAVSQLPKSVITNQASLRLEAEARGISFDARWREYIDEKLREWTPDFMSAVDSKAEEFRETLMPALNELLGISGKSALPIKPEVPDENVVYQQDYEDIISAYVEQIKSGFKPDDMISLVQDYMVRLKDAVSNYVAKATGENLNLADDRHSGSLTYWADWAFSYARPNEISSEEGIEEAISALEDRTKLVKAVNVNVFNGEGDVFSSSFGRVLSYFADMLVYRNDMDYQKVESKIQEFGSLFSGKQSLIFSMVEDLTGSMDTTEKQAVGEKFTLLYLSKTFEEFDGEAMDEYAAANKSRENYVDKVKYSRHYTFDRGDIIANYVCPLEAAEVFDDIVSQEVMGKIEQYVSDIIAINNKFQTKFGQSYDTATVAGVDALLNKAFTVDVLMEGYMREDVSVSTAHSKALTAVLNGIDKMEEFPELSHLEENTFAIDDDVPTFPISDEPYAIGNFGSLVL